MGLSRMSNRMETKSSKKQNPSEFLRQIIGKPVVVKLNSGVDYRGVLACLDGYMNIALEQTEEYVNGQLKNKYRCVHQGQQCSLYFDPKEKIVVSIRPLG